MVKTNAMNVSDEIINLDVFFKVKIQNYIRKFEGQKYLKSAVLVFF